MTSYWGLLAPQWRQDGPMLILLHIWQSQVSTALSMRDMTASIKETGCLVGGGSLLARRGVPAQ